MSEDDMKLAISALGLLLLTGFVVGWVMHAVIF